MARVKSARRGVGTVLQNQVNAGVVVQEAIVGSGAQPGVEVLPGRFVVFARVVDSGELPVGIGHCRRLLSGGLKAGNGARGIAGLGVHHSLVEVGALLEGRLLECLVEVGDGGLILALDKRQLALEQRQLGALVAELLGLLTIGLRAFELTGRRGAPGRGAGS